MQSQARSVTTTQLAVHEKLAHYVERYQQTQRVHAVSEHTAAAFEQCLDWLRDWSGPIIFDACCGVGESTARIAERYPDCKVIGIDKSAARLAKHQHYANTQQNYQVVRADVSDFWYLARQHGLKLAKHFLLYPNPYPKPSQLQKRWHASPSMPDIIALGTELVVRSNWLIFLQEFQQALSLYDIESGIEPVSSGEPLTPFERKYMASGQACWQLISTP
ncbi:tRNA (guanine(46)-N(7))-methyltransferase TrmB [Alteromonas flava]|uniref:tRNA (guanine(46)-N(7))-methyltransferase TrmB n=1 Tax=Alteromonas flava TaxID=2048003 RepID=UPI000C288572|nr:methyltransferase domain-containing protein [Alteromonas flava]